MKVNDLQELGALLDNNSPDYKGKMQEYQTVGRVNVQKRRRPKEIHLNPYQNLLYKRAVFGLTMYTEKELKKMHWEKKRRIKKVHQRAQESINLFKQERVNQLCDALYEKYFMKKNRDGVKRVFCSDVIGTDPNFISTLELKDLGITKSCIVKRFVEEGILPPDFYELKEAV